MTARRPLVAGNWKMNGLSASSATLDGIIAGAAKLPENIDVLVCPPFLLIPGFAAPRRLQRGAPGFSPSSALVRPALSAMPEMRSSLCARSSTARCRTVPSIW